MMRACNSARMTSSLHGQLHEWPIKQKSQQALTGWLSCFLAPRPGLEPGTYGLTGQRFTFSRRPKPSRLSIHINDLDLHFVRRHSTEVAWFSRETATVRQRDWTYGNELRGRRSGNPGHPKAVIQRERARWRHHCTRDRGCDQPRQRPGKGYLADRSWSAGPRPVHHSVHAVRRSSVHVSLHAKRWHARHREGG